MEELKTKQTLYDDKLRNLEEMCSSLQDNIKILARSYPLDEKSSSAINQLGNVIDLLSPSSETSPMSRITNEDYTISASSAKKLLSDSFSSLGATPFKSGHGPPLSPLLSEETLKINIFVSSSGKSFPACPFITQDMLPSIESIQHFDKAMIAIIEPLMPHPANSQYRQSLFNFFKKQIRRYLNCNAFEVGLSRINCFLPEEVVKISIVVNKANNTSWYSVLSDRLSFLADKGLALATDDDYDGGFNGSSGAFDSTAEAPILCNHVIKGSTYTKPSSQMTGGRVHGRVDSLEIEVQGNNKHDLCMLAFIEEVALLVGRDHLFKRALLLVRTWWTYETVAYVQCQIKYYLPDFALCIMLISVFNQYLPSISSPFQVCWG